MFMFLLRFLLIFWIISVILRWLGRPSNANREAPRPQTPPTPANQAHDLRSSGKIVDAEFEDLDNKS
jgi:hypothetical protein